MLLRSIVQQVPDARRCSSLSRWSVATMIGFECDGLIPDVYAIDLAPAAAAASIAALWPATRTPISGVLMISHHPLRLYAAQYGVCDQAAEGPGCAGDDDAHAMSLSRINRSTVRARWDRPGKAALVTEERAHL
jgi:hypothetical protein